MVVARLDPRVQLVPRVLEVYLAPRELLGYLDREVKKDLRERKETRVHEVCKDVLEKGLV